MPTKLSMLRNFLLLDAAVLILLGASFLLVPGQVLAAFHFNNLPDGVNYLLGLWGCVFATLGAGYAVAANNPVRHIVWVQIGIARGALECIMGLIYLSLGAVSFRQAGVGIILGAVVAVAYIALYPRRPKVARVAESSATAL